MQCNNAVKSRERFIQQKQSISKKFLLETLEKYYNDNENAKNITDYILNSRQEKEIDNIKIKK